MYKSTRIKNPGTFPITFSPIQPTPLKNIWQNVRFSTFALQICKDTPLLERFRRGGITAIIILKGFFCWVQVKNRMYSHAANTQCSFLI